MPSKLRREVAEQLTVDQMNMCAGDILDAFCSKPGISPNNELQCQGGRR